MGDGQDVTLDEFVGAGTASDDESDEEGSGTGSDDAAAAESEGDTGATAGAGGGDGTTAESESGDAAVEGDRPEDAADETAESDGERPDAPPSPTVTSRWAPEDGRCDRCGEATERLWREGEAEVCPSCKDWE